MTTTSLSKQLFDVPFDDYVIRVVDVVDTARVGNTKMAYGVFNRHTGVREAVSDTLWMAFATVFNFQEALKNVLKAAQEGQPVEMPAGDMPRVQ